MDIYVYMQRLHRRLGGKSAILTALCVAFGSRAKETQRGSTLKDFIKTGCSYAVVHVELKNQGEDAFKPDIYGDVIIIERKISGASNATVLKDHQDYTNMQLRHRKQLSGLMEEL